MYSALSSWESAILNPCLPFTVNPNKMLSVFHPLTHWLNYVHQAVVEAWIRLMQDRAGFLSHMEEFRKEETMIDKWIGSASAVTGPMH